MYYDILLPLFSSTFPQTKLFKSSYPSSKPTTTRDVSVFFHLLLVDTAHTSNGLIIAINKSMNREPNQKKKIEQESNRERSQT